MPLLTDPNGPLQGELAFGLACGVHLAMGNGVVWNRTGPEFKGYEEDTAYLKRLWHVTDNASWRRAFSSLTGGNHIPVDAEIALGIRVSARRAGMACEPDWWRHYTAQRIAEVQPSPDDMQDGPDVVGRILAYEERFRTDGLLAPGTETTSVLAFDYGRAVTLARWAVGGRVCDEREAAQAITFAGSNARAVYGSWEAYSAGYTLGRVLWYDDGNFGSWYLDMLDAHRTLMSQPGSPWRTLAWA